MVDACLMQLLSVELWLRQAVVVHDPPRACSDSILAVGCCRQVCADHKRSRKRRLHQWGPLGLEILVHMSRKTDSRANALCIQQG
jgi:hypothetical protein